jgi:nucleotide-binding universal stress UspA family protein
VIVCGVDACEDAARAALVASDLAARLDTPLLLLHAAPPPWLPDRMLADWDEQSREEAEFNKAGHMATVLDPVRVNPAATVLRAVEFGDPADVLRSVALATGATHIVVGRRGRGAVGDILLASTSGALARDAPCPVILVPPDVRAWIGGSGDDEAVIVCGLDDADVSIAAAGAAGELARDLDARLVLAHVAADAAPNGLSEEVAEHAASAAGVAVEFETLRGSVSEGLVDLGRRERAVLFTVGSRGRGVLAATVLGSVSRELVQKADVPVMVVSPATAGR